MKKFFLAYAFLLLGLFAAFSYLESHTKDQRILKAKLRHTFQPTQHKDCPSAFALLTNINREPLERFYRDKAVDSLKKRFCAVLKASKNRQWSIKVEKVRNAYHDYQVNLINSKGDVLHNLFFLKKQGSLALVEIR